MQKKLCKINKCTNSAEYKDRGCKGFCNKHYLQMSRHGKILPRGRNEGNKIICVGEVCYMLLYNIKGEVNGKTKFSRKHKHLVEKRTWYLSASRKTSYVHKLVVEKEYGFSSQKVRCIRCGKFFGINHSVRAFVPWDKELEYHMETIEGVMDDLINK